MRATSLLSLALLLTTGCPDRAGRNGCAPKSADEVAPQDDPAVADIAMAFDPQAQDDPSRMPKAPAKRPLEVALRYLLVTHEGARNPVSKRSQAAALRRAAFLVRVARKVGADFSALAARYSELPKASRGVIEIFRPKEADPTFINAGMNIGVGQIADPVHTSFGYYVIERVEPEEYSTAHILVMYDGAKLAPPGLKRTKEEARKRAEMVAAAAKKGTPSFAVLAGRYSDSPSKLRGGVIAPLRAGKLLPGFEPYWEAARQLKVGEVSGVVETPYGFHVIKRLALAKILVRHILIAYTGGETKPREPRTKEAALGLAMKIRSEAVQPQADFGSLAEKYSDGPSAQRQGLLDPFARGEMVPRFEQYAFALKPGQVSDAVETKFGYHVIKRER